MKRRRGIEGSERSLISVSSVESFQVWIIDFFYEL
jgi:hypothetical protein